jgi:hypothetical protein
MGGKRMMKRVIVVLVLGALVLTACGGDDEPSDGDSAANGGGETAGETGGAAETGGDGAATGIDAAQCADVAAAMAAAAQGLPAAFSGGDVDIEDSVQQLEAFASAAPEEIRADMQTIYEGYSQVIEAFASSDWDPASGEAPPPEVIAQLTQLSQELDSAEFQSAVESVNAYFEGGCQG